MLTESPEENKLHSQSEGPLLLRHRPATQAANHQWAPGQAPPPPPFPPPRLLPECDDDGGGLGARCDERDDEEEDKEGDQGAAGAVALPRHSVAVLIQVGLHDDQLQLVGTLSAGRRRDDLPALDAGAV